MALVGKDVSDDPSLTQLQAERTQLQSHLQRCLYEIQQRDLHCQQLNAKVLNTHALTKQPKSALQPKCQTQKPTHRY